LNSVSKDMILVLRTRPRTATKANDTTLKDKAKATTLSTRPRTNVTGPDSQLTASSVNIPVTILLQMYLGNHQVYLTNHLVQPESRFTWRISFIGVDFRPHTLIIWTFLVKNPRYTASNKHVMAVMTIWQKQT